MFFFCQNFVLPHSVSNMENNLFTKNIFHLILQISSKNQPKKKPPETFLSFSWQYIFFWWNQRKKNSFFFSGDKKNTFLRCVNKVEKIILLRFFFSLTYTWRKCPDIFSLTWFQTLIIFSPGKKYCMSSQTEKFKEETTVFFPTGSQVRNTGEKTISIRLRKWMTRKKKLFTFPSGLL